MLPISTYILSIAIITLCAIIYLQHKELKRIQDKFEELRKNDVAN